MSTHLGVVEVVCSVYRKSCLEGTGLGFAPWPVLRIFLKKLLQTFSMTQAQSCKFGTTIQKNLNPYYFYDINVNSKV